MVEDITHFGPLWSVWILGLRGAYTFSSGLALAHQLSYFRWQTIYNLKKPRHPCYRGRLIIDGQPAQMSHESWWTMAVPKLTFTESGALVKQKFPPVKASCLVIIIQYVQGPIPLGLHNECLRSFDQQPIFWVAYRVSGLSHYSLCYGPGFVNVGTWQLSVPNWTFFVAPGKM